MGWWSAAKAKVKKVVSSVKNTVGNALKKSGTSNYTPATPKKTIPSVNSFSSKPATTGTTKSAIPNLTKSIPANPSATKKSAIPQAVSSVVKKVADSKIGQSVGDRIKTDIDFTRQSVGLSTKYGSFEGQEVLGGEAPSSGAIKSGIAAIGMSPKIIKAVGGTVPKMFQGIGPKLKQVLGKTAVQKEAQVGTLQTTLSSKAPAFVVNTKKAKMTTTMLSKMANMAKDPKAIAGALMAAVGSYPFAGFVKEEALQTISFGVGTAINNDDLEGADKAMAFQEELLNPDMWDKIKASIPFVNVLDSLDNFYKSAQQKMAIDKKVIEDKRIQQETGETEAQRWARNKQEQADQERETIDYYNEQRQQMLIWESEQREAEREAKTAAERAARKEEADFWAKEREKQRELEAKDREAQAKFWLQYKKEMQRLQAENRPSQLSFGGLF